MELELNRDSISCFDLVLSTTVGQEETLEAIVPDACPDILRIAHTGGQIYLMGKNLQEGSVTVSGTVKAWILYQPESGERLCRMEVRVPFSVRAEGGGIRMQDRCVVEPILRGLDTRALNPRKVLVRADIGVEIRVYHPDERVLCRGITCEGGGVQQLTAACSDYITAAVQEKEFAFSDELRLSAGPVGAAELLGARVQAWCGESKVIGNKLIFKGEADLQVLYQVEDEVCSGRFPMPFSQIMEISNAGEGADCTLDLCVTELECTLSGEDMRTMNAAVKLLAQAAVRDCVALELLQDAYSTGCEMAVEQEICSFVRLLEQSARPQSVRELLETDTLVKSVVDARLTVCEVKQSRQADQLVIQGDLRLNVLYLDDKEEVQTLNRLLSVGARLDLPAQSRCQFRCTCPGEVFAAPAAGGIEVRFTVEFHCLITAEQRLPCITAARIGEPREGQADGRPSVVLRLTQPGEVLWDIAKTYATTREQILQANQLEGEELPSGQMLLIPGLR